MRLGFYPTLAIQSIRKNKRLYLPYLLTCAGMVMMFYIIHYLAAMPLLMTMAGGRTTGQMLGMGTWIVALFAVIFLFYTNSFLMRRRQKEFGLYNILGMGKGNLSLLLLWENVFLFIASLGAGLLGGIALSKLAELGLMRVIHGEITYDFTVNPEAIADTVILFAVIFLLIFLKGLIQLWRLSTVSLLKSENTGEKPPRANYLLGFGGIVLLAAAYYMAVSIQSPLSALTFFFIAVGMVILATFLVFVSGSVMLCRLLQKNKGYYYKKNHFVSVSSMAYRMRRNGAGLASICILSTMVLVMLLGSGSLYFGAEDSLHARFPRDITTSVKFLNSQADGEAEEALVREIGTVVRSFGIQPENEDYYLYATATGMLRDGTLVLDKEKVDSISANSFDDLCQIYVVPLDDYNRCMGAEETLEEDQVLLHCIRRTYDGPTITMENGASWQVKKHTGDIMASGNAAMDVIPSVYMVVSDLERALDALNAELGHIGVEYISHPIFTYGFDTELPAQEEIALCDALRLHLRELENAPDAGFTTKYTECREEERQDFYGTFGGIFFLGILLSLVFLLATVLIIYYKQITEGYEDEGRFEIMQKVGMSRQDIRKSVNSQMLTVFALPLITAVLHLGFAFPMVQKLLMLFNLRNAALMLTVMAVTVLLFGLIYALIYKLTANAYFSIVSGGRKDA